MKILNKKIDVTDIHILLIFEQKPSFNSKINLSYRIEKSKRASFGEDYMFGIVLSSRILGNSLLLPFNMPDKG